MIPEFKVLEKYFIESSKRHHHLCPRQVLGVRLGLCGLQALGLINEKYSPRFSNGSKQLLVIVETDGCGVDGLAVTTDCDVGRRTLRIIDYGKVAATLIDTKSGKMIRVAPSNISRDLANIYSPTAKNRWHSYLEAYQIIPDEELVTIQEVQLTQSIEKILSKPEARVVCDICNEEIFNEREINSDGRFLCQFCSGGGYYSY